ncbi:hypothetical protein [uncultured Algimonas sp.]|uniref:hypothetical protein n=1 Tax=uncultured Algimonas sp. TaxID=1547920 RepID=UPI002610C933|nr:hypothetical protein [uncultured Algimonas sp.]
MRLIYMILILVLLGHNISSNGKESNSSFLTEFNYTFNVSCAQSTYIIKGVIKNTPQEKAYIIKSIYKDSVKIRTKNHKLHKQLLSGIKLEELPLFFCDISDLSVKFTKPLTLIDGSHMSALYVYEDNIIPLME